MIHNDDDDVKEGGGKGGEYECENVESDLMWTSFIFGFDLSSLLFIRSSHLLLDRILFQSINSSLPSSLPCYLRVI